jgi:hypothetical protein
MVSPRFSNSTLRIGRFVKDAPSGLQEGRKVELKEIPEQMSNPVAAVLEDVEKYIVAFLNQEGGSIFWGINNQAITKGVKLNFTAQDHLKTRVPDKLQYIRPSYVAGTENIELHPLYASATASNPLSNEYVIEVAVPSDETEVYFTNNPQRCLRRTDGGNLELTGPDLVRFVIERKLCKKLATPSSSSTGYWGFTSVLGRIDLVGRVLRAANLLWVDDQPRDNFYERVALSELGAQIDLALSTQEALSFLDKKKYHAIISDMARDGVATAGIQMLASLPARSPPVVFYLFQLVGL